MDDHSDVDRSPHRPKNTEIKNKQNVHRNCKIWDESQQKADENKNRVKLATKQVLINVIGYFNNWFRLEVLS